MSIFKKSSWSSNQNSTRGFYLGSAEAEAENQSGTLNHSNYFEDYLDILPQISQGRFIITGRKGAGKSAIAKFIKETADSTSGSFADIIRLSDLELEKLKQFDQSGEFQSKERIIVEWIILVRLISLIVKNEDAMFISEIKPLKRFIERNTGIVKIDEYEVSEIVINKKFDVGFEVLARSFKSVFSKYFDIKTVKAPFFRLINPLREIVQQVIKYDVNKNKDFVILFDDLDVNLKAYDEGSINIVTDLLRVAKTYNTEIFRGTGAKVIIFMRDDIRKLIDTHNSDTAKIFSSYEIKLKWYDHEAFKKNENFTHLKRFINKRIRLNFIEKGIEFNEVDPWSTLVQNEHLYYSDKTAFKYFLDCSFYRPRDLILFFNPIGQNDFRYPLQPEDFRILLKYYVEENMGEIKNELSLIMRPYEVNELVEVLKKISIPQNISKWHIVNAVLNTKIQRPVDEVIKILLSYSLLGLKDKKNSKVVFDHREKLELDSIDFDDYDYVVHRIPYYFFNPPAQNLFG